MKQSLLQITQHILSSIDGDEVNSISDTTEALQVANVIKGTYIDLVSGLDFPEKFSLYELEASGDSDLPLIMYLPSKAQSLLWVKYNNQEDTDTIPLYKDVTYQSLDEFLKLSLSQNNAPGSTDTSLDVMSFSVDGDTFDLPYRNDLAPRYYTTFNDRTILFDSLRIDLDTTLVKNKTFCYGKVKEAFELTDDYTPDLDSEQFSLLINKAKDRAFAELKQTQNINAMKEARFQLIHQQRTQKAIRDPQGALRELPNFGRKR